MTDGALRGYVRYDALSQGVPEMFVACDDMSGWMDNVSGGEVQMDVGEVPVRVGEAEMNVEVVQMNVGVVPMLLCLLRGRVGVLHVVEAEVPA